MTGRSSLKATLLLLIAVSAPLTQAQTTPPPKAPTFSVATIKPSLRQGWSSSFTPDSYIAFGVTLQWVIMQDAYAIYDKTRVSGGPDWLTTAKFDIQAKVDDADLDAFKAFTQEQRQQMLQALLADRFKLVTHHETKEFRVFALTVAKSGSKLEETKPEEIRRNPLGNIMSRVTNIGTGHFDGQAFTMSGLADTLSRFPDVGRFVVDKTGLTGRYNFALHWTPDNTPADSPIVAGPSIFTALQEQLGLKLDPTKAPIDTLVIDHAESPSAN